jgi:osmotically-inducible protein OsmY
MKGVILIVILILIAVVFFNYRSANRSKNTGEAIRQASQKAADQTAEKFGELKKKLREEKVPEKIKQGAQDAVVAVKQGAKKVEELTLDASITAAIKMKLTNDDTIEARTIKVDTKDGIVTLTGTVKSRDQADRAVKLAKEVEGVKSVNSHLIVQSNS